MAQIKVRWKKPNSIQAYFKGHAKAVEGDEVIVVNDRNGGIYRVPIERVEVHRQASYTPWQAKDTKALEAARVAASTKTTTQEG